jgi:hypothetical protein
VSSITPQCDPPARTPHSPSLNPRSSQSTDDPSGDASTNKKPAPATSTNKEPAPATSTNKKPSGGSVLAGASKEQLIKALEKSAVKQKALDKKVPAS